MEELKKNPKLFDEVKVTGDKINRTMLSKLVVLLFSPANYKKLIDFRFSVLTKGSSEYWCDVNSENFRPLLKLLEHILGENYLHFQNLLLKSHDMHVGDNVTQDSNLN